MVFLYVEKVCFCYLVIIEVEFVVKLCFVLIFYDVNYCYLFFNELYGFLFYFIYFYYYYFEDYVYSFEEVKIYILFF